MQKKQLIYKLTNLKMKRKIYNWQKNMAVVKVEVVEILNLS